MKKNFFAKSLSALLALIMIMGVFAVMPVSAAGTDDEVAQASLIPYHLADNGDLLILFESGAQKYSNAKNPTDSIWQFPFPKG